MTDAPVPLEPPDESGGQVSRRTVLGAIGAVGAGAAVGAAGGFALGRHTATSDHATVAAAGGSAVAFHGPHQAGIATPAQDRLIFGSFDVTAADRQDLVALLKTWTASAARLAAGQLVGDDSNDQDRAAR